MASVQCIALENCKELQHDRVILDGLQIGEAKHARALWTHHIVHALRRSFIQPSPSQTTCRNIMRLHFVECQRRQGNRHLLSMDHHALSTQEAEISMAVNLGGKAALIAHLHARTARCETILCTKLLDEYRKIIEICSIGTSGDKCLAQRVATKTASNHRPNLGIIHAQNRAVRQQQAKHVKVVFELRSSGSV